MPPASAAVSGYTTGAGAFPRVCLSLSEHRSPPRRNCFFTLTCGRGVQAQGRVHTRVAPTTLTEPAVPCRQLRVLAPNHAGSNPATEDLCAPVTQCSTA